MRTLVAAPVGSVRDYSLAAWAAATASYDRLLVADEPWYGSRLDEFGIPWMACDTSHIPQDENLRHRVCGTRFNALWRVITDYARWNAYDHVLSLESDVIPPEGCDILALMESQHEEGKWLCHATPWPARYHRTGYAYEMGCTLASLEMLERGLAAAEREGRGLYNQPLVQPHKHINFVPLRHFDDEGSLSA